MPKQFPYISVSGCVWLILHTCNIDQQETWSSETPSVSSLYQSAHEPSGTSLELKKKQHSIQGMNTFREWVFNRQQSLVNRVFQCRQCYLHSLFKMGYWHLESIWEVFLVTPSAIVVKHKNSRIPGCLICSGPLFWTWAKMSQQQPDPKQWNSTAHSSWPRRKHTHQALLQDNSHSQRKEAFLPPY